MTETDMAYCWVPGEGPSRGHSAGRGQKAAGKRWSHPVGGDQTKGLGTRQRDWEPVGEALQGGSQNGQKPPGAGRVQNQVVVGDLPGCGWHSLLGTALQSPKVGRAWCVQEQKAPRGLGGQWKGRGAHSHLRSSRLLLGQARCWPGGFWVLCRQASMAEVGRHSRVPERKEMRCSSHGAAWCLPPASPS